MPTDKWIGRKVMIIYMDQQQHVSQRVIRIQKFKNGILYAHNESKSMTHTFREKYMLTMEQVKHHVT
ncbi:hypothetical protein BK120_14970 [Paenibacillus sp. FSL A5-0031]|uniref:hypothetical protein n=1 Tax=Paenibacillus sp. FSL A5-0031 TaxID=1920420 RepID=UPI00096E5478|nr:hypothetical protein [Paenibacillus sp. FSL A5-0031]OME83100.1 hypothetical protein BK120_14970 [Paenibacillus sp. FSL A5-0031]